MEVITISQLKLEKPKLKTLFVLIGRAEATLPSRQVLAQHKISHDENRVKIQVPSAIATTSWNSPAPLESRGVVTVLEGPQSCTTVVESLSTSEPATATKVTDRFVHLCS